MKRISLFFIGLLVTSFAFADFVNKSFDGQQVTIEEAVLNFNEWFGTGDSEFILFFDETDEIGMRDMDYQQYINGVKVENCALYVHSRNGYVTLINGDIMPAQSMPVAKSKISAKDARKKAKVSEDIPAERTFIHETSSESDVFYDVYKIMTDTAIIYVNVETGEIIRSLSLIQSATTCSVTTKYKGAQTISCETVDGEYNLRNDTKNIRTCLANMENYDSYPTEIYKYTNSTTNWDGYYLTSVTISAVHNAWWNTMGEDSYPDLYIRIKDALGNYLFTSDYKQDCGQSGRTSFPVTFYISDLLRVPSGGGLTIEIYDQDLISDTKGHSITLSNNTLGSYTWGNSSSNTQGSIEITKSHPAFDLQWGLEKAYDFYNNVFGLPGFNGQSSLLRAFLHYSGGPNNIKPEMDYAGWISIFGTNTGYYNNAYASGNSSDPTTAYLFFGIGNEIGNSGVGLNTVVHEFTHLVTTFRPKGVLMYQGESGAINEGYSDAMAISNDVYIYGTTDWLFDKDTRMIIDNVQYSYIRNLKNPKAAGPEGPKPDTYGGQNWIDPSNTSKDNGGVHMNNSIFTHWYYILCEGKTGVNDKQQSYSISPIGMAKALAIIWRMHRTYLPPQATFAQARQYAIQSAIDLFPGNEDVLKSVTDAWYAVGVGDKYVAAPDLITIKAMMPSNWGNTISAWTWTDGSNGSWASLTKEGSWYSYTSTISPLNIVFVNGSNWSTDQNQTVDITLTESSCIQINGNGTGKRTYTIIDCEPQRDNYVVLARRSAGTNWFYMTSDLGTATTKRYQAVDAGTSSLANVNTSNLDSKYYWQIEDTKLHTAAGYSTWTSGNSAILDNTGKDLTIVHQTNDTYTFSFVDGTDIRYLALNATAGNNYFAYYKGTNQIYQLTLIKEGEHGTTMDIEEISCEEPISTKILHNGQIFILRGDKTYNLQGQEVKLE